MVSVGGPYSTRVQYSDGRIETISTPVEFETGTKLVVVKKQNGTKLVSLAE
jgi:hypothetical protein